MAALLVPTAAQCLQVFGPLVLVFGIVWFWRNAEVFLAQLFPRWEWERTLGWLNLRANRRAERILRVFTHLLHTALLLVLIGILVLSRELGQPWDTDSYAGMFSLVAVWIYLITCYGFWVYYFAAVLAPRIREEFEAAELQRYRLENPEHVEMPKAGDRFQVTVWDASHPRRF